MTAAPDIGGHAGPPWAMRIKHRLATSPLAGPLTWARRQGAAMRGLAHPELALLRQEDRLIDAALDRLIGRDWHCLDVGGHLGAMAYRLSCLAPKGSHTIVEADPAKADMLRRRFPQARVHGVAVSDTEGTASFFINVKQAGYSSLANRDDRGATHEIAVPVRRLDDLIGEAQVDFIKIDIEGFEFPALRGASGLLQRCRPAILFEAGAIDDMRIDTALADELFVWLTKEMGYEVFAALDLHFDRPPLTQEGFRLYRRYPFMAFNYFALHRSSEHPMIQSPGRSND